MGRVSKQYLILEGTHSNIITLKKYTGTPLGKIIDSAIQKTVLSFRRKHNIPVDEFHEIPDEKVAVTETPNKQRNVALRFLQKGDLFVHPGVKKYIGTDAICSLADFWCRLRPFVQKDGKPIDLPGVAWRLGNDIPSGVKFFINKRLPMIQSEMKEYAKAGGEEVKYEIRKTIDSIPSFVKKLRALAKR